MTNPIIGTTGKVCYSKQVQLFFQTINDFYEIEQIVFLYAIIRGSSVDGNGAGARRDTRSAPH